MPVKKYTIEEIKAIVEPIARKYGVARVYLFGSYARGDVIENSDVDFRVDKGSLKGMFALCGLYTEIEEALEMKVDVSGVDTLELIVENAGDGSSSDWGIWLSPKLSR